MYNLCTHWEGFKWNIIWFQFTMHCIVTNHMNWQCCNCKLKNAQEYLSYTNVTVPRNYLLHYLFMLKNTSQITLKLDWLQTCYHLITIDIGSTYTTFNLIDIDLRQILPVIAISIKLHLHVMTKIHFITYKKITITIIQWWIVVLHYLSTWQQLSPWLKSISITISLSLQNVNARA